MTNVATTQKAAAAKAVGGATTEMQAVQRAQQTPANVRAGGGQLGESESVKYGLKSNKMIRIFLYSEGDCSHTQSCKTKIRNFCLIAPNLVF